MSTPLRERLIIFIIGYDLGVGASAHTWLGVAFWWFLAAVWVLPLLSMWHRSERKTTVP